MLNKTFLSLAVLLLFMGSMMAQNTSVPTLPVDQITAGMKGKGRTVFGADRIEEFDVEILGVLRNYQPRRNLILARLEGRVLENAGVIEGMSGSPVYVDGKLVGAVAYSLGQFSKEAIAGITPIEEMLAISTRGETSGPGFSPSMVLRRKLTLEELVELNRDRFPSLSSIPAVPDGALIRPLSLPLLFSGFPSRVFEKAKPLFSRLGFVPVQTGSFGRISSVAAPQPKILEAGAPVAVRLVSGDLDVSAVGTVTHREGDRIWAFGHPLYNLGSVDFAMTTAQVMAVVPSLMSSRKIAAADQTVGRFTQDRTTGVLGELGKTARYVPIHLNLTGGEGKLREFRVEVADDKILTPLLVNMVTAAVVSSEERSYGDLTLNLKGDIYMDDAPPVHLEDLFSGNLDMAMTDLSGLVTAAVYMLTNNEFKQLRIHRIDLDIGVLEEVRFAYLEKVWLAKYEARPGEHVPMKVYIRNSKGQTLEEELVLPIPHLPSGSEFTLVVGDALSLRSIETSQYRTTAFVPRSLYQLIRLLNSLRKNNNIYFKIIAAKPGLFLRGEEMPNLPPSMKAMFSSPRASSLAPVEITRSTLGEYRHVIPYVFRGLAVIPVKVK